ncbi:MAG: autotransporter-associated beta strand repeat-containing protein, partial [Planctomycetota bacterium]
AFYKGNGTNAGYWKFATQSDVLPDNVPGLTPNQANYFDGNYAVTQQTGTVATQNYLTDVDAFSGSPSAYGTLGQSGNISEYNDLTGSPSPDKGIRGGGWMSVHPIGESASSFRRHGGNLASRNNRDGFRLSRQIDNPVVVFNIESGTMRTQRQEGMAVISSAANVTKIGPGTLIFDADNTYSGLTTISSGTLQLGAGGTSGSIGGSVINNSALVFNRADFVSFSGTISGTGILVQLGTGTLNLCGTTAPNAVVLDSLTR